MEVSEVIIVVMTDKGLNSLLSSSFKIGGDASIAAGPVGAGAKSTVTADLISFARAKGVYGGLNLDGTVVSVNGDWNDAYYGEQRTVAAGHPDPQDRTKPEVDATADGSRQGGQVSNVGAVNQHR